jgi:riboflavin synthase
MFTGLVQAIGHIEPLPQALRVLWHQGEAGGGGLSLADLVLGDSVAVDGVCLTVRRFCNGGFEADVSPETLQRSTLAERARSGGRVNLEPALRLADRLGGHLVSGHVDGLGRVQAIKAVAGAWDLQLAWEEPAMNRYICEKGSIAVNGISLTVAHHDEGGFSMAVIPHTWEQTTLQDLRCGDVVNLEADLLAKYVERLLQRNDDVSQPATPDLTRSWLAEHGWTT